MLQSDKEEKMKNFIKSSILSSIFLAASIILTTPALSTPIADGVYKPSEGYTLQYTVDFGVDAKNNKGTVFDGTTYAKGEEITVGGGELYLYNDVSTNDLYGALVLPLSLVDNTYGENSVGWGKNVAPSGKNHNLKDLTGSDDAAFTITDQGGDAAIDFLLDYGLTGGSTSKGKVTYGTSLAYNYTTFSGVSGLFSGRNPSSPETNYSGGKVNYSEPETAYTTKGDALNDWIYQVIYEFKVDGSAFSEDFNFGGVSIGQVHISPNKIGDNKVFGKPPTPVPPGAQVPEPATILLLGSGLLGLFGYRKKFWKPKN